MEDIIKQCIQSTPKYLPVWYRYDKQGSIYNDQCFDENEFYYFHRCEFSIFKDNIQDIIPQQLNNVVLADMGSGNCVTARIMIDEILKRTESLTFIPIDISDEFLQDTVRELSKSYGRRLVIKPVAGDYKEGIKYLSNFKDSQKIILWLSGLQNEPVKDQVMYLKMLSATMTDTCRLINSLDITQEEDDITKAYFDDKGVSARLYLNSIHRLNKDYKSGIELENLECSGDFVKNSSPEIPSYVRLWVKAITPISTFIEALNIQFNMEKGELLYLHHGEGVSCKYTIEQIQNLATRGSLSLRQHWQDDKGHVAVCSIGRPL